MPEQPEHSEIEATAKPAEAAIMERLVEIGMPHWGAKEFQDFGLAVMRRTAPGESPLPVINRKTAIGKIEVEENAFLHSHLMAEAEQGNETALKTIETLARMMCATLQTTDKEVTEEDFKKLMEAPGAVQEALHLYMEAFERFIQARGLFEVDSGGAAALAKAPPRLSQPTFIESRAAATALSDGRDLRDWHAIDGLMAMLHAPKDAKLQTRFEPCPMLLGWWGKPAGAELETLQNELMSLDQDAFIAFQVCLSWAIEEYQVTTSLDSIITAIGRDKDARRSKDARALWRGKVWRWLLLFDSLAVIGARPGTWREPRNGDQKREKISPEQMYSKDALLKITGERGIGQYSFDNSALPMEVSFAAGPWVNQWRGNREMLSELGNVRTLAMIPRGKPSGAWAACIGFMLHQRWREQASRAPIGRAGKQSHESQRFAPFTRRALLSETWRSDYDVAQILASKDPSHAKKYWAEAVKILHKAGVIGYYKEIESIEAGRKGWQDAWLNQPLDIRPGSDAGKDTLAIRAAADAARKRERKKPEAGPKAKREAKAG